MKKKYSYLDKKYVWHPFTQMRDWIREEPLIIEKGEGVYLYDINGAKYLDGVSSLWVNVHGHRQSEIDRAITRQMKKISHSTLLGLSNIPSIELAEELVKITPPGLTKVFYSDNGSTAVEISLKIAYQYMQQTGNRKKKHFIKLVNAYHGDTIGSVSVGGIDLFHSVYKELLFKTYSIPSPYCYRCPVKKRPPSCGAACLNPLEIILRKSSKKIAGLVMEPGMQAAAGMIKIPRGYLKRVRRLTRQYGVLLILDEVAVGFGRTGKMFASQHERVSPDIMAVAKSITGGYLPLAATLTTKKIFDGFSGDYSEKKTFFHGHTYTGNPLACAAAVANIKLMRKNKTLINLQPKIRFMSECLEKLYSLPAVGDIRQAGMMAGIELVKNHENKTPFKWEDRMGIRVCRRARDYGVILRPLGNVIVIMPPLSINKSQIKHLVNSVYNSIRDVLEQSDLFTR